MKVLTRNLGIAFIISVGIHVIGMSVVAITTPGDMGRMQPYTSVNFLGPILNKTAFDIMIESRAPIVSTTYRYGSMDMQDGYLQVVAPKREILFEDFSPTLEGDLDILPRDFLTGSKGVPDFDLDRRGNNMFFSGWEEASPGREIIYRPDSPLVVPGLYGGKEKFKVKIKVLVDSGGKVKRAEPVTTTGFPRLDITASEYVRSWIFESREDTAEDEEVVVEVVLDSSGGDRP